jgi:spore coat polysaccharide biosynthesis protein SpsF (cytidylyltransferase family)
MPGVFVPSAWQGFQTNPWRTHAGALARVKRAYNIDCLIVAAGIETPDSEVAAMCEATSTLCHRGSLDEVLDCCYRAATAIGRLTLSV